MNRILYLESVAGIAGDMFASSFVDAGLVTAEELQSLPRVLGLDGVEVKFSYPMKASVRATHLDVTWSNESWKKKIGEHKHAFVMNPKHDHLTSHWHAHYSDLDKFLGSSDLRPGVKDFARKVFRLLAEAEARAHGLEVENVSFHEVGAVDSILDVVMAAYCLDKVSAAKTYASPVKLGRGLVKMEHGTHPVPPPACARLSEGFPVAAMPEAIVRENVELSTPTGLAILKALAPEFRRELPEGVLKNTGMGAGTMDLGAYPNVFRVHCLEAIESTVKLPYESDEVIELRCNLDDQTPERTAWAMEKLIEFGALDAWVSTYSGKKSRMGFELAALVETKDFARLSDWVLRHTTTFGLRHRKWDRLKLARKFETRSEQGHEIRYKIGLTTAGEKIKEKAEFEDWKKI